MKKLSLTGFCLFAIGLAVSMSYPVHAATLSEIYKNDVNINTDPSVLFSSDFENNLTGWSNVSWADPAISSRSALMTVITSAPNAHSGSKYLQSKVTKTQLAENGGSYQYISAQVQHVLAVPTDIIFVRFYARFVGLTETPHHWMRLGAGNAGGLANTVPNGNVSFWFDLDVDDSDIFSFYVYWYKMRSSRCEDGTVTPGCAGDQDVTYHYGNTEAQTID